MKFSVEWLKDLSDSKLKPKELAELLSEHTAEAEVEPAPSFKNILVAQVTRVEKHPNADRLRVITLTDGQQTYGPVVCGAWNFDVGARVALALPGAMIPHDQHDPDGRPFTLTKAKIRGIESQGMICSGKELGLSMDGEGIMLLGPEHKLGKELAVGEDSLDISSFANRPDLYSYLGVAREIAALSGTHLREPSSAKLPKPSKGFSIEIRNNKHCAHFSAVTLKNVRIQASPDFIQKRLKASGLRPINNVVDATNYAMLLCGQPLHAYDAAKLDGGLVVRVAEDGEKIVTLDGVERELSHDMLVVADQAKALGVAGIIGGKLTAVSAQTTDIVLEAANFDAVSVRKTARKLNIRTDASTRFEKSLPIAFAEMGLGLAVALLQEHAGAKVVARASAGKQAIQPKAITFSAKQINGLLGTEVSVTEQKKILSGFGFRLTGAATLKAVPPSWRPDATLWEDLAEEVVRAKGVNAVPATAPSYIFSSQMTDPLVDFSQRVSETLLACGLSEIYTYSFTPDGNQAALEIANPLNDSGRFMRTSILPNMARTAEFNSRFFDHGMYFELGDIYRRGNGGYVEMPKLGLLAYSKNDFRALELGGIIQHLANRLSFDLEMVQHADTSADIRANGKALGTVELVQHPDLKIVGASLDLRLLLQQSGQKQYAPIPRFPTKALDTSLVLDDRTAWAEVVKAAGSHPLLHDIQMLETYRGQGIPGGKKSLTMRLIFLHPDRTLTDQEAAAANTEILAKITEKTKGIIRV